MTRMQVLDLGLSNIASGRINYMSQEGIEASVHVESPDHAGLVVRAKPSIVTDGHSETRYHFFGQVVRVDFYHNERDYGGSTFACIVRHPSEGAKLVDNKPFGSHEVTQQEAEDIVNAGYDALRQLSTQIPATIPNPLLAPLDAILKSSEHIHSI